MEKLYSGSSNGVHPLPIRPDSTGQMLSQKNAERSVLPVNERPSWLEIGSRSATTVAFAYAPSVPSRLRAPRTVFGVVDVWRYSRAGISKSGLSGSTFPALQPEIGKAH